MAMPCTEELLRLVPSCRERSITHKPLKRTRLWQYSIARMSCRKKDLHCSVVLVPRRVRKSDTVSPPTNSETMARYLPVTNTCAKQDCFKELYEADFKTHPRDVHQRVSVTRWVQEMRGSRSHLYQPDDVWMCESLLTGDHAHYSGPVARDLIAPADRFDDNTRAIRVCCLDCQAQRPLGQQIVLQKALTSQTTNAIEACPKRPGLPSNTKGKRCLPHDTRRESHQCCPTGRCTLEGCHGPPCGELCGRFAMA